MKVSHIEHLGVAVKSLDEAIPYWENVLGLKCYAIEEVADQKVRTAFFMLGQTKIELLEPTSEDSTIAKYIENRGVGIHHMALACENIEEQLADAEAKGIRLIDKTPRKGAEGLTIAFLHPKSTQGILTELCENKNKNNRIRPFVQPVRACCADGLPRVGATPRGTEVSNHAIT